MNSRGNQKQKWKEKKCWSLKLEFTCNLFYVRDSIFVWTSQPCEVNIKFLPSKNEYYAKQCITFSTKLSNYCISNSLYAYIFAKPCFCKIFYFSFHSFKHINLINLNCVVYVLGAERLIAPFIIKVIKLEITFVTISKM